jgi:enamine deaminase RidA (YjgF/YER057c/UK114 family)
MAWYDALVEVAGETFRDIRPAATMVVCGLTTPEMKVEIEVDARIGAHGS